MLTAQDPEVQLLLQAFTQLGVKADGEGIARVVGSLSQGSNWETIAASLSHFGIRTQMLCPASVPWVVEQMQGGSPVLVAGNFGQSGSLALVRGVQESQVILEGGLTLDYMDFLGRWQDEGLIRPAMVLECEVSAAGVLQRTAAAKITPKRQRTQFTCVATSISMALGACGIPVSEDEVNEVLGAQPKRGATWDQAIRATTQLGGQITMVTPTTLSTVRDWTDAGDAVLIGWNPEGREWSHASVVFDVSDTQVWIADPNIPDPSQTVRVLTHQEFYAKWYERYNGFIVRRPAIRVARPTIGFRTRTASMTDQTKERIVRVASLWLAARKPQPVQEPGKGKVERYDAPRNPFARAPQSGAGQHNTRDLDALKGRGRPKHQKPWDQDD